MTNEVFSYPVTIKEIYLDLFGHVNNAQYLTLFEEARWQLISQNGYGVKKILETGLGPTILEIKLNFLKELRVRDQITIESQLISYEKKIGKMIQRMIRGDEICCTGEFVYGLFSVKERKLVLPTEDWLKAVGAK